MNIWKELRKIEAALSRSLMDTSKRSFNYGSRRIMGYPIRALGDFKYKPVGVYNKDKPVVEIADVLYVCYPIIVNMKHVLHYYKAKDFVDKHKSMETEQLAYSADSYAKSQLRGDSGKRVHWVLKKTTQTAITLGPRYCERAKTDVEAWGTLPKELWREYIDRRTRFSQPRYYNIYYYITRSPWR